MNVATSRSTRVQLNEDAAMPDSNRTVGSPLPRADDVQALPAHVDHHPGRHVRAGASS